MGHPWFISGSNRALASTPIPLGIASSFRKPRFCCLTRATVLAGGVPAISNDLCASPLSTADGPTPRACLNLKPTRYSITLIIAGTRRMGADPDQDSNRKLARKPVVSSRTRHRRKRSYRRVGNKTPERCPSNDRKRCRIGDRSQEFSTSSLATGQEEPALSLFNESVRDSQG